MELANRTVGDAIVVDVSGKLTVEDGCGRLKDRVTSLLFEGHRRIVLNLARLSYVDSMGLGEIVACHSTATRHGGAVKLAATTSRIRDLLVLTRLLTVFESYETEAEAVASFASA